MVQSTFLKGVYAVRPAIPLLFAYYAAYMAAAVLGQWLIATPGVPIIVWPPNGVTLAALLTSDRRLWPWFLAIAALGELTGNVIWFHNPILPALGYISANMLEVVAAAFLLTRFVALPISRFENLKQVLAFLGVAAVVTPVIGATVGSAIDHVVGKNPFQVTWPYWWLGDATGVLIATPFVISVFNAVRQRSLPGPLQIAEAAAIGLLLAVLGVWIFFDDRPFTFVLFLPILWAAIRYEMLGTALAIMALVLVIGVHSPQEAITSTFLGGAVHGSAVVQLFILAASSTGLIVAAIIRQYRRAAAGLEAANSRLEQRVVESTSESEAAERRFRATFENAAVGIGIVDPDGTLVSANDSLAKMLGYEAHELEGSRLESFTHPDDLPANTAAWDRLRDGSADSYVLEKRYLRKDEEVVWGLTSVSCVRNEDTEIEYLIKVIQDISARKRSDDARQILLNEVNHRSKNLLSVIQAIAKQTAAKSTPRDFLFKFGQRLQAMSASQDLLIDSGWEPVTLEDVVRAQIAHLADGIDDRFSISGPPILLLAPAAQSLGMAVHELATNAIKYGSLSVPEGRVQISWQITGDRFEMAWTERNGPEVGTPGKDGFGSTVIDEMIKQAMSGEVSIDYTDDGLEWRLQAPLPMLRS